MNSKCEKCHLGSGFTVCKCGWDKVNREYVQPLSLKAKLFTLFIITIITLTIIKQITK